MRFHTSSVLLSALFLSLPISVAYGDTFAFTPAGGTTLTFVLNDSLLNEFIAPSYGIAFGPVVIDNRTDEIIFYNLAAEGAGPIDFAIDYDIDIPSKTGSFTTMEFNFIPAAKHLQCLPREPINWITASSNLVVPALS
jgi:hypothetical protein